MNTSGASTPQPSDLPASSYRSSPADTHTVINQPPLLPDFDAFSSNVALAEAVEVFGGPAASTGLSKLGTLAGSVEARQWGVDANVNLPVLHTHDRHGNRIDEVSFHPAWHQLMGQAVAAGLHAAPWASEDQAAHVTRAAGFLTWSQVEAGHGCPISMTYAIVPALAVDPAIRDRWLPGLASATYDFGLRSPQRKAGLIAGMAMTEKQGGSDVRANTTVATPTDDGGYTLAGHKYFVSAPMGDVYLMLAQAPGGLTCFVVPRVLDDGTRNVFRIQRLKDKVGNRSNATSEVELSNTWAVRLGDEGRGVRTIVEMVSATRLDCVLGSAAIMRAALVEAIWHARHRQAFGRLLSDQPLMQAVLADLALETEAATWLGLRLAQATDRAVGAQAGADAEVEASLRRIALPAGKYFVCKRTPMMVAEALECLGGPGYMEDSPMPRLYREAPVNSVWEGSGSVNALDLLRALARNPETLDAWLTTVGIARGVNPNFDAALDDLLATFGEGTATAEANARRLAERLTLITQAALLLEHAPDFVSDSFCATRLSPTRTGCTFGTLPDGMPVRRIIDRAFPEI
ncbi:MAG: acyl-CoA dehydrogenase family protein [Candidatus Nanopelagicales bacterium]|nr:acyl-CoA dehydrogenase family protein [Candidatus Nanopelagicales bacterium]